MVKSNTTEKYQSHSIKAFQPRYHVQHNQTPWIVHERYRLCNVTHPLRSSHDPQISGQHLLYFYFFKTQTKNPLIIHTILILLYNRSKTYFSNTLEKVGNREIGLRLSIDRKLDFLQIGFTIEYFNKFRLKSYYRRFS